MEGRTSSEKWSWRLLEGTGEGEGVARSVSRRTERCAVEMRDTQEEELRGLVLNGTWWEGGGETVKMPRYPYPVAHLNARLYH